MRKLGITATNCGEHARVGWQSSGDGLPSQVRRIQHYGDQHDPSPYETLHPYSSVRHPYHAALLCLHFRIALKAGSICKYCQHPRISNIIEISFRGIYIIIYRMLRNVRHLKKCFGFSFVIRPRLTNSALATSQSMTSLYIYLGINLALGIFFDRLGRRRFPKGPNLPELFMFYFVFVVIGLPITFLVLASGVKDISARSS